MAFGHTCQQCGRSCSGSRVVPVDADETARLASYAAHIEVRAPFDGGALRRNMGTCCMWSADEGCRLHAHFGAQAKPRVCRQFPFVRAGESTAIDPACPHAHVPGPPSTEPLLGAPSRRALPVSPTLEAMAAHVGLDDRTLPTTWAHWPWAIWRESADLGPALRDAIDELAALTPTAVAPWPEGARAVAVCWSWRLGGALDDLVLGACAIASAPTERRRPLLASWVKLVR